MAPAVRGSSGLVAFRHGSGSESHLHHERPARESHPTSAQRSNPDRLVTHQLASQALARSVDSREDARLMVYRAQFVLWLLFPEISQLNSATMASPGF